MEKLEAAPVFLVDPRLVDVEQLVKGDPRFPELDGALILLVFPGPGQSLRDGISGIPREEIPSIISELRKVLETK